MSKNKTNWENQLGPALYAHRAAVSNATGYLPFQALYGQRPHIPKTIATNPPNDCDIARTTPTPPPLPTSHHD